jgi:hypothetical protein
MSKTYDYPIEDMLNPIGNSDMTARAKFYQRSLYKETSYPEGPPRPLDSWYDKNLYGKIDPEQNTIIPAPDNLVQISRAVSTNLYCLNFVNDAFTAFAEHMQTAFLTGCLASGGNAALYNPRVTTAYVDSTTKWTSHRNALIQAFVRNYNESTAHPITNFNEFKPMFIKYLLQMSKSLPITKTSLILSSGISSFGSGLKIGISQLDCGNDELKYDDYVADPNFEFYAAAAKKYGFIVDKYAPWMLMYDLFTDASMYYINNYLTTTGQEITENNFFQQFFVRTYDGDMPDLEQFIYVAYDRLLAMKPIYQAEKTAYRPECQQLYKLQAKFRAPRSEAETVTPKELIDTLITIRYHESAMSGPPVESIKKKVYEIYRTDPSATDKIGLISAFINQSYKKYIYPSNYDKVNIGLDTQETAAIIGSVASATLPSTTSY